MSLLNLDINWADTRKRQNLLIIDAFSFQVEEKWSSQLMICNFSHYIFSYVEIQKDLLENYDGQAFNVIQVLNITCSPSLK